MEYDDDNNSRMPLQKLQLYVEQLEPDQPKPGQLKFTDYALNLFSFMQSNISQKNFHFFPQPQDSLFCLTGQEPMKLVRLYSSANLNLPFKHMQDLHITEQEIMNLCKQMGTLWNTAVWGRCEES